MRIGRALYFTPRFHRLVAALGGKRREAIAIITELYILAEEYYLPFRYPMPLLELEQWELPAGLLKSLGYINEVKPRQFELLKSREIFADFFKAQDQRNSAAQRSVESEKHHNERDSNGRFAPKNVPRETTRRKVEGERRQRKLAEKSRRRRVAIEKKKMDIQAAHEEKGKSDIERGVDEFWAKKDKERAGRFDRQHRKLKGQTTKTRPNNFATNADLPPLETELQTVLNNQLDDCAEALTFEALRPKKPRKKASRQRKRKKSKRKRARQASPVSDT